MSFTTSITGKLLFLLPAPENLDFIFIGTDKANSPCSSCVLENTAEIQYAGPNPLQNLYNFIKLPAFPLSCYMLGHPSV